MVSRITRLPLPIDDTPVAGWDATIDVDVDADTNSTTQSTSRNLSAIAAGRSLRTAIAPHAMAHEHFVCGIHSKDWIIWKTSLAPHRVCQVASNASGTLIAATLDNGTLSILRGSDGTVLATRRVAPEGTRLPASVEFVYSRDSTSDTLIILPPDEGPPILVSNMQGERLNDVDNPGIVAEAARSMGLHAVRLDGCDDIRAMRGFTFQTAIRLAIVDGDGRLAIYDYDVKESTATLVNRHVHLGNDEEEWEIDMEVGPRVQVVPISSETTATFLVFPLYAGSRTKICWLNLQDLTVACEYLLSSNLNIMVRKRVRILAIEPVASCSGPEALAIVVAIKFPGEPPNVETRLIQAVVGDALDEVAVKQPHLVYAIPVPSSIQSMAIAPVSDNTPYSFICKTWAGDDKYDCYVFSTSTSSDTNVGLIRLLCAKERFQQAHDLLIKCPDDSLVKDPFAKFHSSEITVKRLDCVLDAGSLSTPQALAASHECLQQLVQGALSGHSLGQKAFLSMVDRILHWPDKKALENPPFLQEVVVVLEGIIAAMMGVSNAFDGSEEYSTKMTALQERLLVVDYVQDVLHKDQPPARISKAFGGVQNFRDLFGTLVNNKYFSAAETLSRSNFRSKLTAESMASSVLAISPEINPHLYSSLLTETIFPSLSISHELLPPLLAWACKTADAFDSGNENTLDDAIFLLESTERATKELRLRVHASFSILTPFVDMASRKRRKVDLWRLTADSGAWTTEESDGQVGQNTEWQRPNPTILEMGRLKGGAQKARVGGQNMTIDAVDENEDNVEFKLSSARCLKYARSLGLDHHRVMLATFAKYGGAQNIAKELVKEFSSSSTSHEERIESLCHKVQPFCTSAGANFDEALISYVRDLCGDKETSKSAIEEAASVARCATKVGTKCQVTLVALKAALFFRFSPPWLSQLSQEAIEWAAGDSSLRSELEEASRLLLIDGIVGRYCGEGAKELFHVDNPQHAVRLLQHVACHYRNETVIDDSLGLCGAFAHLSREDACSRILEHAIMEGDKASAVKLMMVLYEKNSLLARAAFSRVIAFCIELIEETGTNKIATTEKLTQSTSCALALTTLALSKIHSHASNIQEGFSTIHFDEPALEDLLLDLKRLETLQKDHLIYLPFSALREPKVLIKTISDMLIPVVDAYLAENTNHSGTIVIQTKRVCSLLSGSCGIDSLDLWYAAVGSAACRLAMESKGHECLQFMSDHGIFESSQNNIAARSCLAVALAFCLKASKIASNLDAIRPAMKHIIMALSILQDNAVRECPKYLLNTTVEVVELCDVVTQVLIRTDEGIGEELDCFRKKLQDKAVTSKITDKSVSLVRRQALQPTWYVGDGLLLPPGETLMRGLEFCKQALRAPTKCEALLTLHGFVDSRGAHSLGLRLLSVAVATRLSSKEDDPSYFGMQDAGKKTIVSLAERYVGGTSSGFTSGIVDSQMAVSVLLSLPLKMAFGVYKSSLPTAISTRDFSRVITLANVGTAAGTGKLFPLSAQPLQQWARQRKFVAQCQELALRAKWWKRLQECGVPFDPNRFQDASQPSQDKTKASTKYVLSLVPCFISKLSRRHENPEDVLKCVVDFADAFDLGRNVAVQKYISHLLSPPESMLNLGGNIVADKRYDDIRMKLARLDSIVKSLVRRLDSQVDRVYILRQCLRRLEEPENSCDYERLSVVLSLYQSELTTLLTKTLKEAATKNQVLELELIDRRRDALAILSWYFQGDMLEKRPKFSKLFVPLPTSWDDEYTANVKRTTNQVLGPESGNTTSFFDPLQPLDAALSSCKSVAAAAALAPLCLPLGVPRGYVHARSLIARFKKSKQAGAALPSFEEDVLPVLNRLKVSEDVADLAEWCAVQYSFEDEDKLHSLDHALTFAMKASNESEMKSARITENEIVSEENVSKALDRVKRITVAKDLLADRLAINAILNSVDISEEKSSCFARIVKTLIATLDEKVWHKEAFLPERFIEIFIEEASLIASEACLSRRHALSIGQLRDFSVLVHRACTALSDKYSHVQVGGIGRRLARRWLFYGDRTIAADELSLKAVCPGYASNTKVDQSGLQGIDEDDTMNFVMDLNALQPCSDTWSDDFGALPIREQQTLIISEEESRVLCDHGSAREASDMSSRRASLRIAFTMAFSGGSSLSRLVDPLGNDENEEPSRNVKSKQLSLRSKLSARGSKHRGDPVLEHSRDLLHTVFARSVVSSWIIRDLDTSIDSKVVISANDSKETITFAMRHRALRVASILCPQEALQAIVDEEELMGGSNSTLAKSAFAAFVAKEIEEMGLPLPHSDLAQLSTMHFPSYARALWRHHRDDKRAKGRLLLLILELYLREKISDHDFFVTVLEEMEKLNLPRTILLAFECIYMYINRIGPDLSSLFIESVGSNICVVVRSLSHRIIQELKSSNLLAPRTDDVDAISAALRRLAMIMQCLAKTANAQVIIVQFVESLLITVNRSTLIDQDTALIVQKMICLISCEKQQSHLQERAQNILFRTTTGSENIVLNTVEASSK